MNKHLVVGDIHGKVDVVRKVLSKDIPAIFVGDFLDSFDKTVNDQYTCFQLVKEAIKNGKAIGIKGNHELSYMYGSMRASGYTPTLDFLLNTDGRPQFNLLKDYYFVGDILITHAGLSLRAFQNSQEPTVQDYLNNLWNKDYFSHIGKSRGGDAECGGIFWCDLNDEFEPIEGLRQIFGHSRISAIQEIGVENFAIDCLDTIEEVILIDNGSIFPISLDSI